MLGADTVAALVATEDDRVSGVVGGAVLIAVAEQKPVFATASHCFDDQGVTHVALGADRIELGTPVSAMFPLTRGLDSGRLGLQKRGDLAIFTPLAASVLPPMRPIQIAEKKPASGDNVVVYVWRLQGEGFQLHRSGTAQVVDDEVLQKARETFARGRRTLESIRGFGIATEELIVDGDSGGVVISGDSSDTPKLHGVVSAKTDTKIAAISTVPPELSGCASLSGGCLKEIGFGAPGTFDRVLRELMRERLGQMEERLHMLENLFVEPFEERFHERLEALLAFRRNVEVDPSRR